MKLLVLVAPYVGCSGTKHHGSRRLLFLCVNWREAAVCVLTTGSCCDYNRATAQASKHGSRAMCSIPAAGLTCSWVNSLALAVLAHVCVVCVLTDDPGTPYSRRSDKSSSEPGDVELMSLHDSSAYGEHRLLPAHRAAEQEARCGIAIATSVGAATARYRAAA